MVQQRRNFDDPVVLNAKVEVAADGAEEEDYAGDALA